MLIQIEISKEFQFLIYLIPVIIGIQISFSFFIRYQQIQDEDLPLNRILLAFGSFIFFIIIGPLFIQIARNFLPEGFYYDFFYRIGWTVAFSSTLSVSFFITREEFSPIINIKYAKMMMILNFISIIFVIFSRIPSFLFTLSIIFVATNGLYIIRFMLVLIIKSVGKIKKNFKKFFIGAMISIVSLVFATLVGLQILPPVINEFFYFFGVSILLIGFIIMAFSVYDFPPFYEFNWKKKLQKLFVIDKIKMECLYSYNFEPDNKNNTEKRIQQKNIDELLPKGIIGIESLLSTLTDSPGVTIEKIKKKNSHIYLRSGNEFNFLIFILMLKEDLKSASYFIKAIRDQFESFFKAILMNLSEIREEQTRIFHNFNYTIENFLDK